MRTTAAKQRGLARLIAAAVLASGVLSSCLECAWPLPIDPLRPDGD